MMKSSRPAADTDGHTLLDDRIRNAVIEKGRADSTARSLGTVGQQAALWPNHTRKHGRGREAGFADRERSQQHGGGPDSPARAL